METKHTPGPWEYGRMLISPKAKDRRCGFVVNGPDDDPESLELPTRICDLRVPAGMSGFQEGEANARLIAAAPELLAALLRLAAQAEMTSDFDEAIGGTLHSAVKQARAAIAKATAQPVTT